MSENKYANLEEILDEVSRIYESGENRDDLKAILYREILVNALKVKRDELGTLDLKVINRALSEVRYAARVFKPYRHSRKVSIFGSARTPEEDPRYQMAVEFARQLAEHLAYRRVLATDERRITKPNLFEPPDEFHDTSFGMSAAKEKGRTLARKNTGELRRRQLRHEFRIWQNHIANLILLTIDPWTTFHC